MQGRVTEYICSTCGNYGPVEMCAAGEYECIDCMKGAPMTTMDPKLVVLSQIRDIKDTLITFEHAIVDWLDGTPTEKHVTKLIDECFEEVNDILESMEELLSDETT